MRENIVKEVKVGTLIAVGLVILFSAFFIIGGKEGILSSRDTIFARFDNVEGLAVGAPVRLGGMKVGSVNDIQFSSLADKKAIIVKMSIKKSALDRIRADSKAKLGNMGLLGDRTVEISLGSITEAPIKSGQFVPSESGHIIEDVMKIAENAKVISDSIRLGQGSLAEVINDPRLYTNLDSLLIIWSDLSKKINEGRGNLAAVVNDSSLYQNMKKLLDTAAALLAQMNKGHGDLGRLMNSKGELYAHTDSTLASLNRLLDRINQGEGTLGQLASDAELYKKITATLQSLDSLIIDIRENPKRYVKFSLF